MVNQYVHSHLLYNQNFDYAILMKLIHLVIVIELHFSQVILIDLKYKITVSTATLTVNVSVNDPHALKGSIHTFFMAFATIFLSIVHSILVHIQHTYIHYF